MSLDVALFFGAAFSIGAGMTSLALALRAVADVMANRAPQPFEEDFMRSLLWPLFLWRPW